MLIRKIEDIMNPKGSINCNEFFDMIEKKIAKNDSLIFILNLHFDSSRYSSEDFKAEMVVQIKIFHKVNKSIYVEVLAYNEKEKIENFRFVFNDGHRCLDIPVSSIENYKEWNMEEAMLTIGYDWMSKRYKKMMILEE